MSTYIVLTSDDMMSLDRREAVLAKRLVRLKGSEPETSGPDYEDLAESVPRTPDFSQALKRMKALADENRLLTVELLKRRPELCAGEMQGATGLTHATVGHQMTALVNAGMVRSRPEDKRTYNRLADGEVFHLP
jgi:DNA-binding transcriptional ArsR family regulator